MPVIESAKKGDVDVILKLKSFAKDGNEEHTVGTVVVRDGTTYIGDDAFFSFTSLTKIILPDDLKLIGKDAFSGCRSLTEIKLSDRQTSIGEGEFKGCTAFKKIT